MKILMLTWEFPPILTGGLGMACYGMARSLLKSLDGIDLILPASEAVYFPLRSEDDADRMPYKLVGVPSASVKSRHAGEEATAEVRGMLGKSFGAYQSIDPPEAEVREFARALPVNGKLHAEAFTELFPENVEGLLSEVRTYAEMASRIADDLDFDAIYAHDWLTFPAGIMIKKLSGKPLVAHIHSTEFDRVGGVGNQHIHRIEYTGIHNSDRVITVSAYTARLIEESYLLPADRISVVHNAYAVKHKTREKRRIFKEPTVLFMGRITLQKGPDYFLQVARKILQDEKNVRFIMAGKGDLENQIIHKSAELEMGTHFLFSGFLNREEVEEIFSASDIFVLPSVSEPFGIVCLEAMSCATVPIISSRSGVCEIVTNAFKVDFWDVDRVASIILELVRDPDRMTELAKKCSDEVENLQWDEAAGKILQVFSGL